MRLKRLELYGYKSFATRSIFEFGEGITAIVGPNGSGKSNIADAIRWVTGEQSYRILRAKSTSDMIFAGTRRRSRLGMAEVLITLDNSGGWLPIDYSEVTIGRRAYRSGENEYLINDNRVRYRDIVDLLGVAGLARSTYAVINQGMVDATLSLRPEARRVLFEEAAGIAPQLRKRAEALRRIQETERNLERVSDILNELHPSARRLRHQAERAEEYLLLRQDVQELQRIWYGHQWQRHQQDFERAQDQLRERQKQVESQHSYTRSFQQKKKQIDAQWAEQRQAIGDLDNKERALLDSSAVARRERAIATERTRLYKEQQKLLSTELQTLASRQNILQREIERSQKELAEHERVYLDSQQQLEALRSELASMDSSRQDAEQRIHSEQDTLTQVTATVSESRARIEQLDERQAALTSEKRTAKVCLDQIAERLQSLKAQGRRLAQKEQSLIDTQASLHQDRSKLEEELSTLHREIAEAEDVAAKLRAEQNQLVARHELLTRLRQELTGYLPGVRQVLGAKNRLPGILGTVASLMDVPKEIEQAIESALGSRLQNIVVKRWEDAEKAIAHLKSTRKGWATFLPLDTIRSRSPINIPSGDDIIGVASKLVHFDGALQPVFDLLLGRVLIVRDLPAARRLLSRTGVSLIVTLEGETLHPSGALSGGTRQRTTNLLAQEREWRELPHAIATAETKLEDALNNLAAQGDKASDLQARLSDNERQLKLLDVERDAARQALGDHAQNVRDLEREQKWQETQIAKARKELDDLKARKELQAAKLSAAEEEGATLIEHLRLLQQQLASVEDQAIRQRAAELETRTAVAQRTVHSQKKLLESHQHNLEQLSKQIHDKKAQNTDLSRRLEDLAHVATTMDAQLAEIVAKAGDVKQSVMSAREQLANLQREQRSVETERAKSTEQLRDAEVEVNSAILERDRIKNRQTALAREIETELGPIDFPETISHQLHLNLDDSTVELPYVANLPSGLGEEIRHLKTRLRRLGNINPEAPHEYEQLLERQTFLESQASDLRGAIAALHEVIQELDIIIEQDFGATVKAVDVAFRDYFGRLFDGGNARLVLTDPENLSTTGVDIIAHPPGKRAQNLSLLSGGERALTAVALLFALLKANPVPFCFLDEVDAALDETNARRFRNLLLEHAQATQFIVITHNRTTVEAATTMYGVSMGEQGVSQSISLKIESEEE
jgi:chromosome segregation protein